MTKSKNKKVLIALIALLLIVALVIGGILAYFTDTDTATNTFTIGNVRIELTEGEVWDAAIANNTVPAIAQNIQPGQSIDKAPVVKNTGSNPAYVYLKVYVPVNDGEDLFTYTINAPEEGTSAGWTKRAEELHTTDNKYNIYVYEYSEALQPGTGSQTIALFDEVIFAQNMDFTPEQADAIGNNNRELNVIVKAYAIQSEAGVEKATNEMTTQMTSETGEESGNAKRSLKSQITAANYGQKVNYSVTANGQEVPNTWSIFHNDGEYVYIIYDDYLPVEYIDTTTMNQNGMQINTTSPYIVTGTGNADYHFGGDFVDQLTNTTNWSSFVRSDLSSKGVTANRSTNYSNMER